MNEIEFEYETLLKTIELHMNDKDMKLTNEVLLKKYKEFYFKHMANREEYIKNITYNWINTKDIIWWFFSIICIIIYMYLISIGYIIYKKKMKLTKKFILNMRIKYDNVFKYMDNKLKI